MLEAWASHKSFRPVDPVAKDKNDQEPKPPAAPWDENNPTINYRGEKRSNHTHCSTTDPEAMLGPQGTRKGSEVELPRTPRRVGGDTEPAHLVRHTGAPRSVILSPLHALSGRRNFKRMTDYT